MSRSRAADAKTPPASGSRAPHAHIRRRMAEVALATALGEGSRTEKLRRLEAALEADADALVLIGMDETILAAHRRKAQIKGSAK